MTNVYDIIDALKQQGEASPFINTVTVGDITQVDLDKQSIFPLFHITLDTAEVSDNMVEFNVKLLVADLVDYSTSDDNDSSYENEHTEHILNTQLQSIIGIVTGFTKGAQRDLGLQVDDNYTCTPFVDRFENVLAGWESEITIKTPNTFSNC